MEKAKLFGDIYDLISCYVLIMSGFVLFILSFTYNKKGFLYGGTALISVFGGLLLFSYYARYKNRFTEFKADFKSVIISIFVVILIIVTLVTTFILIK